MGPLKKNIGGWISSWQRGGFWIGLHLHGLVLIYLRIAFICLPCAAGDSEHGK